MVSQGTEVGPVTSRGKEREKVVTDTVFADDDTEIFDFCNLKLTFLRFEIEVVFGQYPEDVVNDSLM